MKTDVEKWLKRKAKEGPYYLLGKQTVRYFAGWDRSTELPTQIFKDGFIYTVIWKNKDKVSIGKFKDGMMARYGVATWGNMKYPYGLTDIWQTTRGALDLEDIQQMQAVANDLSDLPIFELSELKDVTW